MIDHFKIFIGFICLLIGAGTVLYLYQISRKFSHLALRSIFLYSIYMLILFTGIVISKYIKLNLSGIEIGQKADVYLNIGTMILILTQLGMLYSLLNSCFHINQISIPVLVHRSVLAAVILVCVSYILRIILAAYGISISQLNQIHSVLWNSLTLLELPILLIFIFYQNPLIGSERQRISRAFAILYFSRFPVVIIFLLLSQTIQMEIFKLIFPIGFFLWYIFVPLIWINCFFRRYADSLLSQVENGTNLTALYGQYNVSQREQEILILLIKGNTNKEIADTLFIAIPTVKNHIHNIYQKLGVNTRYQLIHLVTMYGHPNNSVENS